MAVHPTELPEMSLNHQYDLLTYELFEFRHTISYSSLSIFYSGITQWYPTMVGQSHDVSLDVLCSRQHFLSSQLLTLTYFPLLHLLYFYSVTDWYKLHPFIFKMEVLRPQQNVCNKLQAKYQVKQLPFHDVYAESPTPPDSVMSQNPADLNNSKKTQHIF